MGIILELFRVFFIFWFLAAIPLPVINIIYSKNGVASTNTWLGTAAVFILIFILYRNKLQFSGWYQGKNMNKLPERTVKILIAAAVFLFFLPFLLAVLFK